MLLQFSNLKVNNFSVTLLSKDMVNNTKVTLYVGLGELTILRDLKQDD